MVDGSKILRRLFTIAIIFLMVLPNFIVPVSAATEARMIYSYNFDGVQINTVDTNSAGTLTFAGLSNGSVICMDNDGVIVYNKRQSGFTGSIKNIKSDDNGNIAYITDAGEMAWLTSTGTFTYINDPLGYNASDISIGKTDNFFFITWNTSYGSSLYGINSVGEIRYWNNTPALTNYYQQVEYDSVNGIVVLTNGTSNSIPSNRIYLFNVSTFIGWLNFNPSKVAKNSTQLLLDSFPYRQNISFNNGDTATVSLRFLDSPTATNVTLNSNGTFTFNASKHGTFFLWTYGYNISVNQQMLNLSTWNATEKQLIVSTKPSGPGGDNLTFYFGRPDYTNQIVTGVYNLTIDTVVATNASGWTAPANTYVVYKVNVTGGGAGGDYGGFGGCGVGAAGNASIPTSGTYGFINPSTYFPFTIGARGIGACSCIFGECYMCTPGSGGQSIAFGLTGNGGSTANGIKNNLRMPGDYSDNGQNGCDGCPGGAGAIGFGAGGGGGGGATGDSCNGAGGRGGSGGVNFTYQQWILQYYNGTAMNSPVLKIEEIRNISPSISYADSILLTGNATAISIPEGGGIVGVSTAGVSSGVTGRLYHIIITSTGFGAQYSGTSDIGIPVQVATSDSGTYSIEARGSWIDIYQLDGVLKGQYNTGGLVNSVDISERNGLWAVAGGTDGIFYVFDKATTSGWEVYYQGDSESAINSVAVTEAGIYAAVGRTDGTFEYYDLKSSVAAAEAIFSVDLFVTRGGSPLPNINISIVELTNAIPSLVTGNNITTKTDANGHYVFTVTERNYYNISVNDGEYYQLYQASPTYKVIAVNLPYVLMTVPYQYSATYSTSTHIITSTYNDVNIANINLSIIDTVSKVMVYTHNYNGVKSFVDNFVVPDANKSYKVIFSFTRSNGYTYSDTIYVQSSMFNVIPKNTSDQYTLFIYGVYTLLLMVVSLSIGTQSLKYGTVFLVALTFLGITLGFLPWSLYTAGIATSAFIALLEVYRRRE